MYSVSRPVSKSFTDQVRPLSLLRASMLFLFVPVFTGVTLLESPPLAVSVQTLMVAMTIGTWLAFYPPAAYRRYVLGGVS